MTEYADDTNMYKVTTHTVDANSQCTTTTTLEEREQFYWNSSIKHLMHTSVIFGEEGNYSYEGIARARGVLCGHWIKKVTQNLTGNTGTLTYMTHYYFAQNPPWVIREPGPGHPPLSSWTYPVRALVEGQENTGKKFTHYYDFIEFTPVVNEMTFSEPSACVSTVDSCPTTDNEDAMLSVLSTLFVTLVIALPLGMCLGYSYRKRLDQQQQSPQLAGGNEGGNSVIGDRGSHFGGEVEIGHVSRGASAHHKPNQRLGDPVKESEVETTI